MPLSLLIFVFQPTRLNSLVWRLGLVAFFPLLTSKLFSLSLTLQISRNCSSFTLWSLSPCYSLLICHLSLPIWSVLAYTATSHHPFFRSVNLIFFFFAARPIRGASLLLSLLLFYSTLFHFVGFSYRLPFSLFSYFETCMQAWRLTGGWLKMHTW